MLGSLVSFLTAIAEARLWVADLVGKSTGAVTLLASVRGEIKRLRQSGLSFRTRAEANKALECHSFLP
jgi:hypothetical protein